MVNYSWTTGYKLRTVNDSWAERGGWSELGMMKKKRGNRRTYNLKGSDKATLAGS